jgi:F-type H+-transporting ATPase subunit alpha
MPAAEQIAVLLIVSEGVLDEAPVERIPEIEQAVRTQFREQYEDIRNRIQDGEALSNEDREKILELGRQVMKELIHADTEQDAQED